MTNETNLERRFFNIKPTMRHTGRGVELSIPCDCNNCEYTVAVEFQTHREPRITAHSDDFSDKWSCDVELLTEEEYESQRESVHQHESDDHISKWESSHFSTKHFETCQGIVVDYIAKRLIDKYNAIQEIVNIQGN